MMDARILSRMIERAQKKVEEHHFEVRKHVLQYDDVMNKQREVIYAERRRILEGTDLSETILGFLRTVVTNAIDLFCPEGNSASEWELQELFDGLDQYFPLSLAATPEDLKGKSRGELESLLLGLMEEAYAAKENAIIEVIGEPDAMRQLERRIALQTVNQKWMEHLANMDYLREGINLRGYAQQDPLVVYNKEAFQMFDDMQHAIQDEIARFMFHVEIVQENRPRRQYDTFTNMEESGTDGKSPAAGSTAKSRKKVGRNDPCWCGSGKKYKLCHYPD